MSDDFGTIASRQRDRAREVEVLRRQRESLVKMIADVDAAIRELEGPVDVPASRPLVTPPEYEYDAPAASPGSGLRVLLILGAALLALALIAWLIWRASSDRPAATGTVVEEPAATSTTTGTETETTTTAPATIAEVPTATVPVVDDALIITPQSQDYGLVRKGTRATRQYEITNNSDEPVSIVLARSACRCLYYEHSPVVPPKAKESITVTIDGARAKAGNLRETIRVSSKANPASSTTLDVIATVR